MGKEVNPFEEHAANAADYQAMLKADATTGTTTGGATLTFTTLVPPLTVDCRYERIIDDFELMAGQSPKLMVPSCKFLLGGIPAAQVASIRKPLYCVLKPNPNAAAVPVKLWSGGLVQGGLEYDFMLVDRNYGA